MSFVRETTRGVGHVSGIPNSCLVAAAVERRWQRPCPVWRVGLVVVGFLDHSADPLA